MNLDFSIMKETRITERLNTQFRAEFFNIMNHSNLANPGLALGMFGGVVNTGVLNPSTNPADYALSSCNQANCYNPRASSITSTTTSSRQIQFALKFVF